MLYPHPEPGVFGAQISIQGIVRRPGSTTDGLSRPERHLLEQLPEGVPLDRQGIDSALRAAGIIERYARERLLALLHCGRIGLICEAELLPPDIVRALDSLPTNTGRRVRVRLVDVDRGPSLKLSALEQAIVAKIDTGRLTQTEVLQALPADSKSGIQHALAELVKRGILESKHSVGYSIVCPFRFRVGSSGSQ